MVHQWKTTVTPSLKTIEYFNATINSLLTINFLHVPYEEFLKQSLDKFVDISTISQVSGVLKSQLITTFCLTTVDREN